jgi:hypothetical protein
MIWTGFINLTIESTEYGTDISDSTKGMEFIDYIKKSSRTNKRS